MRRRFWRPIAIAATATLATAIGLTGASSASAAGGTVYVDDSWGAVTLGSDPDGAGAATLFGVDSFATINGALATSPDVIQLAAGTYSEQVIFSTTVTVIGAGAGSTTIVNPGGLVPVHGFGAIVVVGSGSNVTMSGVTVSGPGAYGNINSGVFVVDGGALDLRDSTVTAIRHNPLGGTQIGTGIHVGTRGTDVGGASFGTLYLEGSTISDYQKTGILERAGSTVTIVNNDIVGVGWQCTIASNGIQLAGTADVYNNRIYGNAYADSEAAPCNNTFTPAFGIAALSATGPVNIHDNDIYGNEYGVYLADGPPSTSAITVENNTITGLANDGSGHPNAAASYGIVSEWTGPNALITGNTVTETAYGLYLTGGAETVTSNFLTNNNYGAYLEATPARFAANSIVGNTIGAAGSPGAGANWWGCNGGPNAAGCDTATLGYTEPDWLVLSLDLPVGCEVEVNASINATLSLATTNAGVVTTGDFVPPTSITPITGTLLTPSPASGSTSNGVLPITLTGNVEGVGAVSAQADNALVSAPGTSSDCVGGIVVLASTVVTELPTMGAESWQLVLLAMMALLAGAIAVRRTALS